MVAEPIDVSPLIDQRGPDKRRGAAQHEVLESVDGRHAYLGAAARGEGEAVPLQAEGAVGLEHHVGRRIIRRGIHSVRPVERQRGGKANVVNGEGGDLHEARSEYVI